VSKLTRYVAVCWPYVAARFHNIDNIRVQISAVTFLAVVYNIPRCSFHFIRRVQPGAADG